MWTKISEPTDFIPYFQKMYVRGPFISGVSSITVQLSIEQMLKLLSSSDMTTAILKQYEQQKPNV